MATIPPLAETQLPDGVYIGLDEKVYFAQDRLGSSDLMKLHFYKGGWWWQSRHNPDRDQEQSDAQNYGSALHALMLEGVGAYETRFVVEPDKRDYQRLLFTIPEMKEALSDAGLDLKGTSGWRAPEWAEACSLHIPDIPVWSNIMADFEKSRTIRDEAGEPIGKRPSVSAVEDRMLRYMLEAALEDKQIRGLLGYGEDVPTLAELSFFWTDPWGVKRRARFDKPVPKFTLDLKSLGNWQGRELEYAVGDRIVLSGYDIQVGDQQEARRLMHRMIQEKGEACITGGDQEQRAWLQAIALRDMPWEWVWLFYQKPELSGREPIIFPLWEDWAGRYHVSGYRKAHKAIKTYLDYVERFGLGDVPALGGEPARPWSRIMPMHYTGEQYDPHISLPHFGWDEIPVSGEEEALRR